MGTSGIVYWPFQDGYDGDVLERHGEFLVLPDGSLMEGTLYCLECLPYHPGHSYVISRIRSGSRHGFVYPVYCSECHAPLAECYDVAYGLWFPGFQVSGVLQVEVSLMDDMEWQSLIIESVSSHKKTARLMYVLQDEGPGSLPDDAVRRIHGLLENVNSIMDAVIRDVDRSRVRKEI